MRIVRSFAATAGMMLKACHGISRPVLMSFEELAIEIVGC
jgi:hypothetical protein